MTDILQDLPIQASPARVFDAVSTARGLDAWWTDSCTGEPTLGSTFALGFGPAYQWQARVTACEPNARFELTMTVADADWSGTRVAFELEPDGNGTQLRFSHCGWPEVNPHFRVSAHCWAMYLRLLRRYLEHGETVAYAERLDA